MPNYTTWYDVGGFITSSCFVSGKQQQQPLLASSAGNNTNTASSSAFLVTTTLSDGVHLWELPNPGSGGVSSASTTTSPLADHNGDSMSSISNSINQQQTRTLVSRLSISSAGSDDAAAAASSSLMLAPPQPRFTSSCATIDGRSFLCGTADGALYQGSLGSSKLYRAAPPSSSATAITATTNTLRFDDALSYVAPLSSSASHLFLTLNAGGTASIVDLRTKTRALTSNNNFHCATTVDDNHIALSTDAGYVHLFDTRRTSRLAAEEATRIFSLKNQVTALCSLPNGGIVAGTVGGRILIVRALEQHHLTAQQQLMTQTSSGKKTVVRDEAIALPSDNRFPVTHVAAVDATTTTARIGSKNARTMNSNDDDENDRSSHVLSSFNKTGEKVDADFHKICIVAAAADGSVSFFSKREVADFETQQQYKKMRKQQQQQSGDDSNGTSDSFIDPLSWKAWSWRVKNQKPAALALTTTVSGNGHHHYPLLAAAYVGAQSNQMSRMCVVALAEDKLL